MPTPRNLIFAVLFVFGLARVASANLAQNGDFGVTAYSGTQTGITTTFGQFGTGYLTVPNWTTTGYNFVYAPGTADAGTQGGATAGQPKEAPGEYNTNGYGNTYMWGPNNGSANGLPSTSPAGGNFIAGDGAFQVGAITQTITGLTVGETYSVKFYWAGAQQQGFTGATTEDWKVSLGAQSFTTPVVNNLTKGFTGWVQQQFDYTATSGTETLSFLAAGTPNGQPPFSLLAGVDLEVVPEFTNWVVFAVFCAGCIILEAVRRRRGNSASFR